ncbi:MAG: tetratricopeptide repeat protein [Alteromonadaceae bacterium]|nr:tetratricopeptide repeat protein [Alteromonadaceae bacterium]
MKKLKLSFVAAAIMASSLYTAPVFVSDLGGVAVAQEEKKERKTRRVPTLRGKVYEQLARAQKAGDAGNVEEAVAILDEVQEKIDSMNSYERAMMYNFYGFIYYNAEDYAKAFESFKLVVEQSPIPEAFEQTTLFSLSQLSLMQQDYDATIHYLERWEALQTGTIPAKNNVLKAQAMYQQKNYTKAAEYIEAAIVTQEADPDDGIADENWYILQRAIYYELKRQKDVTSVLVKLVRYYDKPKYWIQLGGMYGEIGEEKKQLAVMEAAYQMGYVTSGQDLFNLAQLYYYHQVPFKAADVMVKAMDDGLLEENLRNLRFLSQCWALAKENDRAIPVMQAAANLSEDGELDAQLAQIFLNTDQWDKAIESAKKALEKGDLRSPGTAHLVIGMSLFSQKRFAEALNALAEAEKFKRTEKMAQQWLKYVTSEKTSHEVLQAELSS